MRWHTAIVIAVLGVTMIANIATADLGPRSNGPVRPTFDPDEPATPDKVTSVSDRGSEFAVAGGALVVAAACGGFWLIRRKKQPQ